MIARGEAGMAGGAAGLFAILVPMAWVFGIGWTWKGRKLGYGIVLVLSIIAFLGFLVHPFALMGNTPLEAIVAAYTSEAVGVFILFALLAWGWTSLTTLLLSIYALVVPKQE